MGRLALRLPDSLQDQLAAQAEHEGVSLNQYLVYLLAQRAAGYTVRIVPPEDVEQQRRDYARLLEELGPPASQEQVRAALAAREPGEPEPGLTPELVGWLEDRLRSDRSKEA